MEHDENRGATCPNHTRESTLNALQVAAEVHEACPACAGSAALYLAALTAMYELDETREGFLRMAQEVWDDALSQSPDSLAGGTLPPVGPLDAN